MDVTGLVVGTVSLLAGFKGAVDGYMLLSDIRHAFENPSFLGVKLKVEQQRLQIWGDYFGFTDKEACERLKKESPNVQGVVLYILMEINFAITDVDRLIAKYGLKLAEPNIGGTTDPHKELHFKSPLLDDLIQRQQEIKSKMPRWRRGLPWTLDLPRFEKLLDRLEYLNDSLERIVPRIDLGLLALGLPSYLIPSQSTAQLSAFQGSSHQLLTACAKAKQIKLTSSFLDDIASVDLASCITLKMSLAGFTEREFGSYREKDGTIKDVLIEWKDPSRNLDPNEQNIVLDRIENLGRMLITPKPSEFRILPCLGLVEDKAYWNTYPGYKRFGFVFQYPDEGCDQPRILRQLFDELKDVPLGDRFRLAQSLASAILLLHSSEWMHKSLRSENIILFRRKRQLSNEPTSVCYPFIGGFAYSRPDKKGEISLERPVDDTQVDRYRHPNWRGGYSRLCDIYSLGVILFEIGLWKPVEKICNPSDSEKEIKDLLLWNTSRRLRGLMGDVYATVVTCCLSGNFGPDTIGEGLGKAFWLKVVKELDRCRA